jgi:hypothetical protein
MNGQADLISYCRADIAPAKVEAQGDH